MVLYMVLYLYICLYIWCFPANHGVKNCRIRFPYTNRISLFRHLTRNILCTHIAAFLSTSRKEWFAGRIPIKINHSHTYIRVKHLCVLALSSCHQTRSSCADDPDGPPRPLMMTMTTNILMTACWSPSTNLTIHQLTRLQPFPSDSPEHRHISHYPFLEEILSRVLCSFMSMYW